uniref:Ig-like domain-containing protein n=1 Tax=Cyprinus carpio TaxID=7962 RepID=A0A8C1TVY9_CYPCA
MNLSATHPLMLFLIGVIFVKQASLTFMKTVNIGTTATLLCSNILKEPSYIAWFKQTNDSLPLCIATQYVSEKPADSIYFNGFKENHVEMSVNKTFSSLKIVTVDISDSGILYCGSFLTNHMMFHNKTQLVVVNETSLSKEDITNVDCGAAEENLRSCHFYYTLTLILSGFFLLLPTVFVIVVLFRLKERKKQKGMLTHAQSQGHNEEMHSHLQKFFFFFFFLIKSNFIYLQWRSKLENNL